MTAPALSDAAALELADQELGPYAMTTFATAKQVLGCQRIDASTAVCSAQIDYEIIAGNRQSCTVEIVVEATTGKIGSKPGEPGELEQKDFQATDGTYGRPAMGDTSECEAAYAASAQ